MPGTEGKAGMAAIVDPDDSTNLAELLIELKKNLPTYACPLFLRILKTIDATGMLLNINLFGQYWLLVL